MASAGDISERPWVHVLAVLALAAVATSLPNEAYAIIDTRTGLAIGAIGAWRYGWGLLHFIRSLIYRFRVYPAMKRRAAEAGEAGSVPSYLLVTSFRIPTETTIEVYRAAFLAALNAPGPSVVVASIVDMVDQRLIKQLYHRMVKPEDRVDLLIVRIAGTGKRDALAFGFRAIARLSPPDDAMVAVIDGDSIVPPDLVARCAPFFHDQKVGALTTDEMARVNGSRLFVHWYDLRFAQRHILMSSMGLSRRVLTLTGRMSMFRASIICDPRFVAQVELDYIDHHRLGRFKFLTGDDKSSWFYLLRNGYYMLYLPDVMVETVEDPPSDSFIDSASQLMVRWYGNMLRTNGRALALGPRRIGLFTWWAILDQRMSMWTCLIGVTIALLATLFISPFAIVVYAIWILSSRYVLTLLLLSARRRVSIFFPILLYFNQIYGSLMKVYVFFRLDKQKWTRQKTTLAKGKITRLARFRLMESKLYHAVSVLLLVVVCSLLMGITSFSVL
ncbi:glycosyltransferase Alg8 [Pseudochelatococcus lubricantis]|uniref:Glycosyltransferase Alg8 n=1 Tax=Pseudochelatococcus lubricantis TaxID=1538102 RepID=A0ABX0UZR3_9HYPH|nr:glycosyltransferase [Pseudochelatococcus lubricantis]NIJ57868.1 glycosyltransferase Alg8 [Pseudochelatococcus lubricantis]